MHAQKYKWILKLVLCCKRTPVAFGVFIVKNCANDMFFMRINSYICKSFFLRMRLIIKLSLVFLFVSVAISAATRSFSPPCNNHSSNSVQLFSQRSFVNQPIERQTVSETCESDSEIQWVFGYCKINQQYEYLAKCVHSCILASYPFGVGNTLYLTHRVFRI